MAIQLRKFPVVDQALHGYRDGHKLLAASVSISEGASAAMSRMSDMQSSGLRPDESYLSLYPLRKEQRFVIARTWLAHEMSRPGCVWTHSLLLDARQISTLTAIQPLLTLLLRPENFNFEDYAKPIDISIESLNVSGKRHEETSPEEVEQLYLSLFDLYFGDRGVTVLPDSTSITQREDILAAVWNQMPPRLRREFVGCTATGSRFPVESGNVGLLVSDDVHHSNLNADNQKLEGATALPILLSDALKGTRTTLRAFIARYVTDANEPRKSVGPLTEIANSLLSEDVAQGIARASQYLVEYFPSQKECKLLKGDLLTGSLFSQSVERPTETISLIIVNALPHLKALIEFEDNAALDTFVGIVAPDSELLIQTLEICSGSTERSLGGELFGRLIHVAPSEILSRLSLPFRHWLALSRIHPNLLSNPNIWIGYRENDSSIEDFSLIETDAQIDSALKGIVSSGKFDFLRKLVSKHHSTVIGRLAHLIPDFGSKNVRIVLETVRPFREDLLRLTNVSTIPESTLEAIAQDCFENPYPLVRPSSWRAAISGFNYSEVRFPFTIFAVFQAARRERISEAKDLFDASFQGLHDLLDEAATAASDQIARRIAYEYRTPPGSGKALASDRVVAALCRAFEQEYWPDVAFFHCARNESTMLRLAVTMTLIPGGLSWIRRLSLSDSSGRIQLDSSVKRCIAFALKANDKK